METSLLIGPRREKIGEPNEIPYPGPMWVTFVFRPLPLGMDKSVTFPFSLAWFSCLSWMFSSLCQAVNSAIPERTPNTLSATPFYTVMTIKTSLQMFLISLCLPNHPTVKKYWVKHFYYLWNKWIHFVSYFLDDAQLEGLCEWTLLWVIKGCLFSFGKDFFGPWFLMNRKEYKRRERKREREWGRWSVWKRLKWKCLHLCVAE